MTTAPTNARGVARGIALPESLALALALALVLALSLAGAPARAQTAASPGSDVLPQQQALLLLRALAYDHKLSSRAAGPGGEVVIAVITSPTCGPIAEAIEQQAARVSVAGRAVKVQRVAPSPDPGPELKRIAAAAAYVCPGLEPQAAGLVNGLRQAHALSFSSGEAAVRAGFSVAFAKDGRATAVLLNLSAVRAEGAELDAALLGIAKVVVP